MSKRSGYWRETKKLTFRLLFVWVLVTFVCNWFASELNQVTVFGFPLGFYMAAQGELLIYLLIIWYYNRRMNQLDAEYAIMDTST